jgi:hypothetical protein
MEMKSIQPREGWHKCVVAATGPSLTMEIAAACLSQRVVAVNDAWRLLPWAEVLYAGDRHWWNVHRGAAGFEGERWFGVDRFTRTPEEFLARQQNVACAEQWGLNVIEGEALHTFSVNKKRIHFGSNSGFQAINLAILLGAKQIVLVGFDMHVNGCGKRHFFGDHPDGLSNGATYERFIPAFNEAARNLPSGVEIINCTERSALRCFPMMRLEDALAR